MTSNALLAEGCHSRLRHIWHSAKLISTLCSHVGFDRSSHCSTSSTSDLRLSINTRQLFVLCIHIIVLLKNIKIFYSMEEIAQMNSYSLRAASYKFHLLLYVSI